MSSTPSSERSPAEVGLLTFLAEHSVDEDYAAVAARLPDRMHKRPMVTMVTVAAASLLVVVAASQTSRDAGENQSQRATLVRQLGQQRTDLDAATATVDSLRQEVLGLQASSASQLPSSIRDRLDLLSLRAGTADATGPGVRVVVDDSANPDDSGGRGRVLDTDLQQLVNGLLEAGAEEIAINGERLTTLSAIRTAGSAITVNFRSLARPYTVEAIGDPGSMPARFAQTSSGAAWLDLQQQVGLRFDMTTATSLTLKGSSIPTLRFATTGKEQPQ